MARHRTRRAYLGQSLPRSAIAKVARTIRKAASRASCVSAKLLLKTAEREHLFSVKTRHRLRKTVQRCYTRRG